ncbi:MAG TPA: DUF3330 domain-containing protein [Usitatibacteraceae bacterium]|nr:DUF3330 domain-containing protein [Usitatibacteraceae bacterium]
MTGRTDASARATVPCATCRAEVPLSVAAAGEAGDYVRYFCGLDCFAAWRQKDAEQCSTDAGKRRE